MPAAYSLDLRERALALLEAGTHTRAEIARLLDLGEATLYEWQSRHRAEGTLQPRPHGGGPRAELDRALLRQMVREQNDLTLAEYAAEYHRRTGRRFHPAYLCRVLRQLRLPRKSQSPLGH